jgi:hypothetical protein
MTPAKNDKKNPVPHKLSDHDERSEMLASEKHWDEEKPNDPGARASQHIKEFHKDGVPLSEEDWENEEKKGDEITDHIDSAVDKSVSLEELAEEELSLDEEE